MPKMQTQGRIISTQAHAMNHKFVNFSTTKHKKIATNILHYS